MQGDRILSLLTALPLRYFYCCKDFMSHSLSPSFFLRCVVLCCASALSAHFLTLDHRNGAAFSKFIFKPYRFALRNTIHDFSHPHVFETSLSIFIPCHFTVFHGSWLLGSHSLPLTYPWHPNSRTLHIKQVGDEQPYIHPSLVWETLTLSQRAYAQRR